MQAMESLVAGGGSLAESAASSLNAPATLPALAMLSSYTHGSVVVPAWMDYLDHADEAHDLTTDTGRQREAIELYVAAKNLSVGCSQPLGFAKRLEFLVNPITYEFMEETILTNYVLLASKLRK